MDEIEARRLHIIDEQWDRTHATWKELRPFRTVDGFDPDNETKAAYFRRLTAAGYRIPAQVLDQWIYPHHYNERTMDNYGWIDYRAATFSEVSLPVDALRDLYVIRPYLPYVETRSRNEPFDDFMCVPEDLAYWKSRGTWRVPPVVMDVSSFVGGPAHAELGTHLQLIEGHSRLGYLYVLERFRKLTVREHQVFLLRDGDGPTDRLSTAPYGPSNHGRQKGRW